MFIHFALPVGICLGIGLYLAKPASERSPLPWAVRYFLESGQPILTTQDLQELLSASRLEMAPQSILISPETAHCLSKEFSKLSEDPYSAQGQIEFAEAAKDIIAKCVPQKLVDEMRAIRDNGHDGVLLVRGMPIDADPGPTPSDALQPCLNCKRTYIAEGVHLGIASLLGSVYTIELEKGHRLIHTVAPVKNFETSKSSKGSANTLSMHQEDRIHPFSPECFVLTCVRADPEGVAETSVGSFWDIAPALANPDAEDLLHTLQKPIFAFFTPEVYAESGVKRQVLGPVLRFEMDSATEQLRPVLALNWNGMKAMTSEGEQALKDLHDMFKGSWRSVRMKPGDMMLIYNPSVIHTRTTAFKVHGDGTDRWLLRSLVHPSPAALIIPKTSALNLMPGSVSMAVNDK